MNYYDIIKYGVALIFLSIAIIYVTIKNKRQNQQIGNQQTDNKQIDIELIIYKKEKDRLEERLRRKELSWDDFVRLRIDLDEQHKKNMKKQHIQKKGEK